MKKIMVLPVLIILAGYYILASPFILTTYNATQQIASIGTYESESARKEQALAAARAYNQKIYEKQKIASFVYEKDVTDEEYESLLSDYNEMCSLYIPSINLYIPVTHGTKEEDLKHNLGHFYGTSLPVGGENTLCAIAGHSALSGITLFDNLTDVVKGDDVYVKVYGETLKYSVTDISIVLPEDAYQYMQIEDGQDELMLYTCTPYAINTHRLLVRCERAPLAENEKESVETSAATINIKTWLKLGAMTCLPAIAAVIYITLKLKKEIEKGRAL